MTGVSSPIPPTSVRSRFVEGVTCAAARVVPGLVPENIVSFAIGSTATIGIDGSTLEDISLWIAGGRKSLAIDASAVHPKVSGSVKLGIEVDPESIFFQSNSFMTEWRDGHEAVLSEEIKFTGGEGDVADIHTMNNLPFSFRWSIATITNVKKARISLQMVPCSLEALDELPDPFSPDLKVSTVYAENVMWATLPPSSWGMPGGLPAFLDRRSVEFCGQGVLPSSWTIKNFLHRFYIECTRNPALSEDEATALILDPTSPPPTDPGKSTRAMWAPLPPEGNSALPEARNPSPTAGGSSGGSGSTPASAGAREPTTGLPPVFNKTTAAIQAKESLNRQNGTISSPLDTVHEVVDDTLSSEGAKMKRMMILAFGDTLPTNLPSWDDLASFPAQDVIAIIKTKISCESENNEQSSLSAFEKATTAIEVPAGKDDGVNSLHPARWFQLPFTPPEKWSEQVPIKRDHVVAVRNLKHLGLESRFPVNTIKKMHNRAKRIKLTELLSCNTNVEDTEPLVKRQKVGEVGESGSVGFVASWDFKSAKRPWEVLEAVMSAICVQQSLFPTDHSYNIIMMTLLKFYAFYDPMITRKQQMSIINTFVNNMLIKNACNASNRLPAVDIDEAEKVALHALKACERPPILPPIRDLMSCAAAPTIQNFPGGANSPFQANSSFQTQAGRGRGRGGGGGGRGFASNPGSAARVGSGPPKQTGLATCPTYNKGLTCQRTNDPSAKFCTARDGTQLRHICSKCGARDHKMSELKC